MHLRTHIQGSREIRQHRHRTAHTRLHMDANCGCLIESWLFLDLADNRFFIFQHFIQELDYCALDNIDLKEG